MMVEKIKQWICLMEMEKQSAHYMFLFEKLVVDGRQKINEIPLIFVPNGIVLSPALDKKLTKYVKQGGTLVAFAPPGVFNEFGIPKSGGLLTQAMPGVKWTHQNFNKWFADGKYKSRYDTPLGKGRLVIFPTPTQFKANKKDFLALMKKHIKEQIHTSCPDFQYSLRERDGVKYLYVLNYSIDEAKEGEFSIKGNYEVEDISLPEPTAVPAERKDGRTIFKTKLAPVELALCKIVL